MPRAPAVSEVVTSDVHLTAPAPVRERRTWPLPLLAPDLAALAILCLAARRFEGPTLAKAVLLGGVVLLVRRGAAGSWLGRDPADPNLTTARRHAHRQAVRWSVLVAVVGTAVAVIWGHPIGTGVVLGIATLPGALVALEHQALRSCALRGTLLLSAVSGAGAALAVAAFLYAMAPSALVPVVALAAGDLVTLLVAWHRPHRGTCHAGGLPSATPLEAERRPLLSSTTASVLIGAMQLLPLAVVLRSGGDDTLLSALVVLGLLPLLAAGAIPVLVIPELPAGRRETIIPALLLGAALGSVATVVVMAAPESLLALPDPRLATHAAYFCIGAAVLGLAQVLVHHRVGAGNDRTAVVLALLAAGAEVTLLVVGTGPPAEVAVNAVLGGAGILAASLMIATALAAPLPFVFPAEEAGDGPRLVGPAILAMAGAALAIRLASLRPMWLDEAATARLSQGSLTGLLDASPTTDAHPPLQAVLAWVASHAVGEGDLAIRLPSLIAGVLIVPLLYVTGQELYGRRTGLVAAALGTLAPALVWFSSEARPPALAALLAVASLLTMVRALRRGGGTDWVLFGLCSAALMWSHQLAFAHLLVLHGAVLLKLWHRRRNDEAPKAPSMAWGGWALALLIVAAATVPLVAIRSGIGPPRTLPPFEFATAAAPSGGVSVFATLGTALSGVLGFHTADVTSRLLALWPLGILAVMLMLGRARSQRGALLLTLVAAPFAALVATQLLGHPRSPPLAVGWVATATPMFCLVAGRGLSLAGGAWPRVRKLVLPVAVLLAVAVVDQTSRVEPLDRFDVKPFVSAVAREAGPDDAIVYEPRALRHLVAYEAPGTPARPVESSGQTVSAASLSGHRRVFIIGAFALGGGKASSDKAVALVKELSATRPLLEERRGDEITVWVFGP